jgi:hypothetical protein
VCIVEEKKENSFKKYFKRLFSILAWTMFVGGNYFAIKGAIFFLNTPNDFTVLFGLFILGFVALSDLSVVDTYLKKRRKNEAVKTN